MSSTALLFIVSTTFSLALLLWWLFSFIVICTDVITITSFAIASLSLLLYSRQTISPSSSRAQLGVCRSISPPPLRFHRHHHHHCWLLSLSRFSCLFLLWNNTKPYVNDIVIILIIIIGMKSWDGEKRQWRKVGEGTRRVDTMRTTTARLEIIVLCRNVLARSLFGRKTTTTTTRKLLFQPPHTILQNYYESCVRCASEREKASERYWDKVKGKMKKDHKSWSRKHCIV